MKYFSSLLAIFFLLFTTNVNSALAASSFGNLEIPLPNIAEVDIDKLAQMGLLGYIAVIINYVTVFIVVIGVIMIVIGGFMYMTAGGDSNRTGFAKTLIKAALLGIVLALTAYLILNTISPQFASDLKDPLLRP